MDNLTQEEREILAAYDRSECVSVMSEESKNRYQQAAKNTFKKDKRVNIRISGKDLELLQERALIEGIPYQTLMSSVLHKFVNGNLVTKVL